MTRAYSTTGDRWLDLDDHCDPSCRDHLHCVCGRLVDDDGSSKQVCVECGALIEFGTVAADALADPMSWEPAEVER